MVVIQQSKIQALDCNEIDAISGAYCEGLWKWLGQCGRLEVADSDPMEPTAPGVGQQP